MLTKMELYPHRNHSMTEREWKYYQNQPDTKTLAFGRSENDFV
jgi:hypothetical protein